MNSLSISYHIVIELCFLMQLLIDKCMGSLPVNPIDLLFDLSQHPPPQAALKLHFNINDRIGEIEPCTCLL